MPAPSALILTLDRPFAPARLSGRMAVKHIPLRAAHLAALSWAILMLLASLKRESRPRGRLCYCSMARKRQGMGTTVAA